MSQHDLNIANQGFPAFRADLNDALLALGSTNSGATAPATTFANQLWYDTANNILKIRNEDNDAWISLLTLNQTADTVSEIATAIATLGAGSASNPALTTAGDANTGIFFPAADTIAFAEGGVEVMRINSSGQVGIGTNNPVVSLQVGASSDVGVALSNSSSVTSGNRGTISMFNSGTSSVGYIRFGAVTDDVGTDIQFGTRPAAGSLTERMRITSAGAVGIGTNNPGHVLDVKAATGTMGVTSTTGTNISYLFSANTGGTTLCGRDNSAGGLTGAAYSSFFYSDGAYPTLFINNGSERMRIHSNGNLSIGTSSSVGKLYVAHTANDHAVRFDTTFNNFTSVNVFSVLFGTNTNSTSCMHFNGYADGANRIFIYGNGNIQNQNNSYAGISDIKLKENITDTAPKLEKLNQVRVVNYNLKDNPNQKLLGVVAQELEQIFPNMVEETADKDVDGNYLGTTTKSVKYSVFVPMLIKAMQEQQIIIENLITRLTALESK